jgi:DNA-binding NarL/FixJ family response regulator
MLETKPGAESPKTSFVVQLSEKALACANKLRRTYAAQTVAGAIEQMLEAMAADIELLDRLTVRQRQVLELICQGMTTKQIAVRLKISIKTVEAHRTQLLKIVDARCIAGLVRFAIRAGLIQP